MKNLITAEQYWNNEGWFYKQRIEFLKSNAAAAKIKFLGNDFASLKKGEADLRIIAIIECYWDLIFFLDEELKEKFRELGLNERCLRWFVPISAIEKKFNTIESKKNIKIIWLFAIDAILIHLQTKFAHDLLVHGKYVNPKKPAETILKKELALIYRRRNESGDQPARLKNLYDYNINNLINVLEFKTGDKIFVKDWLTSHSSAITENNILKHLIKNYIVKLDDQLSETQYYSKLFYLFKLIAKDKKLASKIAFDKDEDDTFLSYENYQRYKYSRIKKIIDKK